MKKHTKETLTKLLKIILSPIYVLGFIIYAIKDLNNGHREA